MILRTLLFLVALYLILYLLVKSIGAFFRQIGRQQSKPNVSKTEEPKRVFPVRSEDIEDAEFEDLPENPDKPTE